MNIQIRPGRLGVVSIFVGLTIMGTIVALKHDWGTFKLDVSVNKKEVKSVDRVTGDKRSHEVVRIEVGHSAMLGVTGDPTNVPHTDHADRHGPYNSELDPHDFGHASSGLDLKGDTLAEPAERLRRRKHDAHGSECVEQPLDHVDHRDSRSDTPARRHHSDETSSYHRANGAKSERTVAPHALAPSHTTGEAPSDHDGKGHADSETHKKERHHPHESATSKESKDDRRSDLGPIRREHGGHTEPIHVGVTIEQVGEKLRDLLLVVLELRLSDASVPNGTLIAQPDEGCGEEADRRRAGMRCIHLPADAWKP